ncbi:MAG: beta-N-acetylhexosaminidase [Verrucomicrobiota bacterium]
MTQTNQGPFERPSQQGMGTYRRAWIPAAMVIMLVAGAGILAAQSAIQIIPLPRIVRPAAGTFALTPQTLILVNSPDLAPLGRYLSEMLAPAIGLKLAVTPPPDPASRGIVLALDKGRADLGQEGYALNCTPVALTITAATPAGVFYGVQTLRQLLPIQIESRQPVQGIAWQVPCVAIDDQPRFKWRGYLIDPARNFRTKEELKRYIDLLALHKLNILQLHLTDDQGWRIEIKRYPKLVETGARLPDYVGKSGDGWFYSQADIRELVRYAADRYVTLVPEIEMPGHSGAAIASYPELACGGNPPGGWSAPLCVSQETTFEFAANVLDEVIGLFPSPFIHIGADEVPPGSWRACAKCKPLMDKLVGTPLPADVTSCRVRVASGQGLPFHEDIGRLQGEFVRRIDQYLTTKGRRMVGWDEILEGGLKIGSHAVVMAWRGASAVAATTGRNQDVVVSLHPDYYLDNDTPLPRTYNYEPVPNDLPAAQAKRVLGVQGNMWGETTSSLQRVDARTFPRLCALAETGWTGRDERDFADFSARLADLRQRLKIMGVDGGKF